VDDGFSGSRLDRPALDALRDAAADGELDAVFVYGLARNYVHQHLLLEELTKRGVAVHFVERPIGASAEDRLLVRHRRRRTASRRCCPQRPCGHHMTRSALNWANAPRREIALTIPIARR
jgi:hypothetical protein